MPKKKVSIKKIEDTPATPQTPIICEHRTTIEVVEDGVKVLKCADCGLIIK